MKSIIKKLSILTIIVYMIISTSIVFASTNVEQRTLNDLKVRESVINENNQDIILKTPKVDETEKIYDFADLFTSGEESELYTLVNDFIETYDMDMAIVTINSSDNNKISVMDYADDFYDYNYFGKGSQNSGVLLLIELSTPATGGSDGLVHGNLWISTTGQAKSAISSSKIDTILDYVTPQVKTKNFYAAVEEFVAYSTKYVKSYNNIIFKALKVLVAPLIIAIAYILIGMSGHKTVHIQTVANQYMKTQNGEKGFAITRANDRFITSHKTRVRRESSSGGSSHSGSSGVSHGGGGRSF